MWVICVPSTWLFSAEEARTQWASLTMRWWLQLEARGQPEGLAAGLHLSMTLFQLCDPTMKRLPWRGNHSQVSHLKISSVIRAGSSWGLCLAWMKTCAFLVRAARFGSRCHEEVVRIRTQGAETNRHLAKSYKVRHIFFWSRSYVTPHSCWFISGWKMLMRHLLPADCVEISWTSFFFCWAQRERRPPLGDPSAAAHLR